MQPTASAVTLLEPRLSCDGLSSSACLSDDCFLLGLVDAIGETLRDTLIQLMTPDRMRGRVKSFDQVFMSAGHGPRPAGHRG